MKWLALAALCAAAAAQQPASPPSDPLAAEKLELQHGIAEANSSEIEVLRFIESYLEKHPATAFRGDLEYRAAQSAIALQDDPLVVRYGEASIARMPANDKLLAPVTHSLLALHTPEAAERALKYARRSEEMARQMQKDGNPENVSPLDWRNQTDRILNGALVDDARATAILGKPEEALAIAQRAFDTYPNAAALREMAYGFERLGKSTDAIRALADAFSMPDAQATDADRAKDRTTLGQWYRKAKGSEEGLGALCLEAYDRDNAVLKARETKLHQDDPNAGKPDVMDFTLSALDGKSLALSSLKGKVVVLDMWATWCVPCREQHPLYERVKERFRDNPAVIFLSINSDADHTPVKSFLAEHKWQGPVYFEDGLARAFAVDGLPATIVLDRTGRLYTHMNGYEKSRFVESLTDRIQGALAATGK